MRTPPLLPYLALLFWFAFATTQALLSRHRFDRVSYGWIGMSLLGFIVASLGESTTWLLSMVLFRLDVLQNAQHGAIVYGAGVIIFGIIMTLSQRIILRRSVSFSELQASLNAILGTATWRLLASRVFDYGDSALVFPSFLVLTVVLDTVLGGIIHKVLNS